MDQIDCSWRCDLDALKRDAVTDDSVGGRLVLLVSLDLVKQVLQTDAGSRSSAEPH